MKTKRKAAPFTATLITIGSLAGGAIAQTLITNGGFETTDSVASSTSPYSLPDTVYGSNGSDFTSGVDGWHVTGSTPEIRLDGTHYSADEGGKFAALTSNTESIAQTFATSIGQQYEVQLSIASGALWNQSFSFWVGAGSSNQLRLSVAGNSALFDPTNAATPPGPSPNGSWDRVSYSFTAVSTSTTLELAANTSGAGYLFVDDVSVTAVPEPSSTALLGLGGLAVILRRRR